jgi:hypothetical protein
VNGNPEMKQKCIVLSCALATGLHSSASKKIQSMTKVTDNFFVVKKICWSPPVHAFFFNGLRLLFYRIVGILMAPRRMPMTINQLDVGSHWFLQVSIGVNHLSQPCGIMNNKGKHKFGACLQQR